MEIGDPECAYPDIGDLEKAIKHFKNKNSELCLVMIIVKFKDADAYSKVKLLGDTELKIPTQFVIQKNICGKQSTVRNIVLKLNSKLGGTNQTLPLNTVPMFGPIFKRPVSCNPLPISGFLSINPFKKDFQACLNS